LKDLVPLLIAGLTTGSVYGLAGVGLVLTYKTSGIFNFAHGSLAAVAAFIFYTLHVQHNVAWPLAAVVAVLVAGPVLGLLFELLARFVTEATLVVRVVATLGVLLIVEAAITLIYGSTSTDIVPQFLPVNGVNFDGATLTVADVILFAVPLLATIGLYCYFRIARTGVAMRAVVDNADLLDLAGTNPVSTRRRAWVIGATFAALSGVLVAPLLAQIDSTTLTLLVITAFGAAAIGSFANLPLTYLGGLVIGVAAAVCTQYFTSGLLSQLPSALPFVVLFIVLLTARKARLATRSMAIKATASAWRAPLRLQGGASLLLIGFLIAVPFLVGIHLNDWATFLADVPMLLSLGLLVRTSGQVSLCQVTFLAIGTEAFSHLTVQGHVPWLLALLIAGLVVVPIGALLAIPAIRLSGLYLALATLGFGIVVQYMFYTEGYMFGQSGVASTVPRPDVSWLPVASDRGYFYLLLFFAVAISVVVVLLERSRLGRLLRAMSGSSTGLAASGTSVNVTRVLVFCLSAFFAAVAGALGGAIPGVVSGQSYPALLSVTYFAVVIISVGGAPWYALVGAAGLTLIPSYFPSDSVTNYLTLAFGVFAVSYALTPEDRRGLPDSVKQRIDSLFGRAGAHPSAGVPVRPAETSTAQTGTAQAGTAQAGTAQTSAAHTTAGALELSDVSVRFGGLVAVNRVSLRAPTGRITGLIGPNGAGKTTTFDVCSGFGTIASGDVLLDGTSVRLRGSAARARKGLGRTFQHFELFDTLTVRENVEIGGEGGYAGGNPLAHLAALPLQQRATRAAALEAMARCDLLALSDRPVGTLSTGQRRLVELARCLAGPFRLLLLDEPSSGLDRAETERFGQILIDAVRERGIGILIVEHDMSLVTSICDYVYVLDFGQLIFSGTPDEVLASSVVRAAYLGDADPTPSDEVRAQA
jgi:ABC-type branched-subunit amino acid transport system ATPase component/branched-subunit amino acid ABC-type transport system permease component